MSHALQLFALSSTIGLAAGLPGAAAGEASGNILALIVREQGDQPRDARVLFPFSGSPISILRVDTLPAAAPTPNARVADADENGLDDTIDADPEVAPKSVEPSPGAVNPDFANWQKRADVKLGAEAPRSFEHPLAKDHPEDYVIVCEAGCRGRKGDEIVSRTPKPVRQAARQNGFDPTSSMPVDATRSPDVSESTSSNVITCEAGCYSGQKIHKARSPRRAELSPTNSVPADRTDLTEARGNALVVISAQGAANGAIVGPHYALRKDSTQRAEIGSITAISAIRIRRTLNVGASRRDWHVRVRPPSGRIATIED